MSSLTKAEFRDELKLSSATIATLDDSLIESFIDRALRAYSDSSGFAKIKWDVDNSVVEDQELYDYPSGAIRIISVRTSDGRQDVNFKIEDQGSGNKIRLGGVKAGSLDHLLTNTYYYSPLVSGGNSAQVTTDIFDSLGYDSFDIEYAALQTMSEISDNALEHLTLYVEYLAYNLKSSTAAEEALSETGEAAESITDADSSGASTTIKLTSRQSAAKTYTSLASEKLDAFNTAVRKVPYGRRG